MARKVKDKRLDSREQRLKLKVTGKPYYRAVERSVHLGYRRLKGAVGTWCARYYKGNGVYELEAIGIADDMSDADGVAVLDFWQAQGKARERMVERAHAVVGKTGPVTVADLVDDYIRHLQSEGRPASTIADVSYRDMAFIRPELGAIKASDLTAEMLRKWRDTLVEAPARVRTKAGEVQKHRETTDQRSRRASANRTWTTLRAALNCAFHADKIASDKAWKKVKPFGSVDQARVRYLSISESKRLINAADPEFRPLLQAALTTGGRYGQLAALVAGDFNADAGTVTMRTRKGNGSVKTYHVHLTAEGVKLFKAACANRRGDDLIFTKADGSAWRKSNQEGPIAAASARAHIDPPANFHMTRHTWASHAVMNGTPLMVVAQNLGHRDTRMVEKHYGHLAPSYVADAVRAGAPTFGIEPDANLASLDDRRVKA
jgi:integrase